MFFVCSYFFFSSSDFFFLQAYFYFLYTVALRFFVRLDSTLHFFS